MVTAGTTVKLNGIPVILKLDTLMQCNPYNIGLILEAFN